MPSRYQHPSLTPEGWTSSSIQVIDQMLSDFYLSEYSQTFAWPDDVKSFTWLLQRYGTDPDQLAASVQDTRKSYLSQQFTNVEVEVIANPEETNSTKHALYFYIKLQDTQGEFFNLNQLLQYSNLKIVEISKLMRG